MELFDAMMRWSHVAAGVIALVVAPVAMATQKGGRAHRRWGRVYFWGMAWIFVSTLGLLLLRPNIFLLGVGTLSFYSAFSADRVRSMKRPDRQGPRPIDWAGAGIALTIGAAVIVWGLGLALGTLGAGAIGEGRLIFAGLGLFFGVTVVRTALDDLRRFRNPPADRNFWWYHHMGGMLGSYVGAVTAFMVQTVSRRMYDVEALAPFAWVVWVLPALIGTPLIERWIRSYRLRFEGVAEGRGRESEAGAGG
jgi:hypothetical protein